MRNFQVPTVSCSCRNTQNRGQSSRPWYIGHVTQVTCPIYHDLRDDQDVHQDVQGILLNTTSPTQLHSHNVCLTLFVEKCYKLLKSVNVLSEFSTSVFLKLGQQKSYNYVCTSPTLKCFIKVQIQLYHVLASIIKYNLVEPKISTLSSIVKLLTQIGTQPDSINLISLQFFPSMTSILLIYLLLVLQYPARVVNTDDSLLESHVS